MSSLFRLPLRGELLWGSVSRFQERFKNVGRGALSQLLIGNKHKKLPPLFPQHLRSFSEHLDHSSKPSATELLTYNTMFPYAAPFLAPSISDQVHSEMLGSNRREGGLRALCNRAIGMGPDSNLRFCPDCAEEDLKAQGFSFWRCIHQIGPLKICPYHKCALVPSNVARSSRHYFSLSDILRTSPNGVRGSPSVIQLAIANSALDLTTNTHWRAGRHKLLQACHIKLAQAGYLVQRSSSLRRFIVDVIAKFGITDLRSCGIDVSAPNKGFMDTIFKNVRRQQYGPSKLGIEHYSLICSHLEITFQELLDTAQSANEPEFGPWPCMSHNKPCSGKLVIHRMRTDYRRSRKGTETFRFYCPHCGCFYFRPSPLCRNSDGTFEYEFSRFGVEKWALDMKEAWEDPSQTWPTIRTRFSNRNNTRIALAAIKLGLKDMPGRSLRSYRRKMLLDKKAPKSSRERSRKIILNYFAQNPGATFAETPRRIRNRYYKLKLCDHRKLPDFGRAAKRRFPGRIGMHTRDKTIAKMLTPLIAKAREELAGYGKGRVTLSRIQAYFIPTIRINRLALKKMPLTMALFDYLIESKDAEQNRRANQMIAKLKHTPKPPDWSSFGASSRFVTLPVKLRTIVRAAYSQRKLIVRHGPLPALE